MVTTTVAWPASGKSFTLPNSLKTRTQVLLIFVFLMRPSTLKMHNLCEWNGIELNWTGLDWTELNRTEPN